MKKGKKNSFKKNLRTQRPQDQDNSKIIRLIDLMGLIRKKSIYETLEDLTSKFVKRIPTGFRKDSIKSHERNKGGNTQ